LQETRDIIAAAIASEISLFMVLFLNLEFYNK